MSFLDVLKDIFILAYIQEFTLCFMKAFYIYKLNNCQIGSFWLSIQVWQIFVLSVKWWTNVIYSDIPVYIDSFCIN